jgi:hypothetical protein
MPTAMPNRLDPTFVRAQIELLRHTHPDIWDADDETLLADMLEAQTGLNELLAAIVDRMCDAEAFAAGLDLMLATMKARRDRFDQCKDAMRSLAFRLMTQADVHNIKLTQATLSVRAGQPRVVITDEARLPEQFVRIKREPDKHLIASHLKAGETVPGAEISNSEPVLSVRVK